VPVVALALVLTVVVVIVVSGSSSPTTAYDAQHRMMSRFDVPNGDYGTPAMAGARSTVAPRTAAGRREEKEEELGSIR